ncbi:MAG: outer-membrane lipoprotein carrier protein LolA [Bacteroides sp.]|nr:outer-membrane lipoprotein carrier protein LolA [Prevotella sp.]MCM1407388.1 outer-membrane lipoprotein carrier protein LolA [Treponema brennaborense]MCM1469878.1 outer-membrane lipoprotein carrier protein LolA [Bacteroides sp.]
MKKRFYSSIALCFVMFSAMAQNQILTAGEFFRSVSERYGKIRDYEADISMQIGRTDANGHVSFKRPNLLRIDFSNPAGQVIVFNGDLLTIYLPGPRAALQQGIQSSGDSGSSGMNLATPQGLQLLNRYYTIAYETGQDPVPLEEDSPIQVVKLILSRKSSSEEFRTITLSVDAELKLIRRVEAVSSSGELFSFTFSGYALNQNIPDTRFLYDAPASANNYNNFLFSE